MAAYYNEVNPHAAGWLRNLVAAGLIPAGDVDERSICDVQPDDLRGYVQCHFFAGLGGWAYAARLAGWPDDRELWSGSCPCQPFSVAGKGAGQADERHLWPEFFHLIRARRPAVIMGEQVAAAVGKDWLDGVSADLEGVGYACGAAVVPACAVDAPHRRDRLWFVAHEAMADTSGTGLQNAEQSERCQQGEPAAGERKAASERGGCGAVEYADQFSAGSQREQRGGQFGRAGGDQEACAGSAWGRAEWLPGADGKSPRVKPGVRLLAHGIPGRVGRLRAYGNAIVPQVAAEVIRAYLDCRP